MNFAMDSDAQRLELITFGERTTRHILDYMRGGVNHAQERLDCCLVDYCGYDSVRMHH